MFGGWGGLCFHFLILSGLTREAPVPFAWCGTGSQQPGKWQGTGLCPCLPLPYMMKGVTWPGQVYSFLSVLLAGFAWLCQIMAAYHWENQDLLQVQCR